MKRFSKLKWRRDVGGWQEDEKGDVAVVFGQARDKAASKILDLGDASRLLGHTDKRTRRRFTGVSARA